MDQHPLQQMFAPGMATNSMSSIADNLALRIQRRQQLGLGESCDVNSAGQWSVSCCSDIMEQLGQPVWRAAR